MELPPADEPPDVFPEEFPPVCDVFPEPEPAEAELLFPDDEPEEPDGLLAVTAELTAGFVPAVVATAVVFVVLLSVFDAEEVFAGSPLPSVLSSDSD